MIDRIAGVLAGLAVLLGIMFFTIMFTWNYQHPMTISQPFETELQAKKWRAQLKGMHTELMEMTYGKQKFYIIRSYPI